MKISELIPDPRNANKGTERGARLIEDSLRKYGAGRSILIDKKGQVIAGNKTLEQAGSIGLEDIIVVQSDGTKLVAVQRTDLDLNDPQAKELAIADNRAGQVSLEWDVDVLKELDAEINLEQFWSPQELEKLLGKTVHFGDAAEAQIDKAEELREKWQTARGQVWAIESSQTPGKAHRLMCGDSATQGDVARLLAGSRPELMVTDPPYGVEYDPHWRDQIVGEFGQRAARGDGATNDDRVDWTAAWNLFPGSVAYVWHAGRFAAEVAVSLTTAGFEIRNQIVWAKQHFAISRGHYHWQHEPCWYAVRKGSTAHWTGDRTQSTLWEIASLNPAGRQEERVAHGTQKPLECMARPMRNHACDDIYEPFSGSGTTLVAAEQSGRVCYAMEIEPKYIAVALERLHQMGLNPCLVTEAPSIVSSTGSQSDSTTNSTTPVVGKTAKKKAAAKREKH